MTAASKAVATLFIERSKELGLKGKDRDHCALEYFVGVAKGAELAGNEAFAKALAPAIVFFVSMRGYKGVEALAVLE